MPMYGEPKEQVMYETVRCWVDEWGAVFVIKHLLRMIAEWFMPEEN